MNVPESLKGAVMKLTPCEKQVLELMGEGLSNKSIAAKLSRGVRTIETHVRNISIKFDRATARKLCVIGFRIFHACKEEN